MEVSVSYTPLNSKQGQGHQIWYESEGAKQEKFNLFKVFVMVLFVELEVTSQARGSYSSVEWPSSSFWRLCHCGGVHDFFF